MRRTACFVVVFVAAIACGPVVEYEHQPASEEAAAQHFCSRASSIVLECDADGLAIEDECLLLDAPPSDWTTTCEEAHVQYLACRDDLDCDALAQHPFEQCREERLAGHETCPEVFRWCALAAFEREVDGCRITTSEPCLDDAVYSTTCAPSGAGQSTCTCSVDGVTTATFAATIGCGDPSAPDDPYPDGFEAQAELACGFPTGTFAAVVF